jgi:hypothetical protein
MEVGKGVEVRVCDLHSFHTSNSFPKEGWAPLTGWAAIVVGQKTWGRRPGQGFSPRAASTDASSMPVGVFPSPTRSLQNFTMIITTETQHLGALGVNMKGCFALRRKYSVG